MRKWLIMGSCRWLWVAVDVSWGLTSSMTAFSPLLNKHHTIQKCFILFSDFKRKILLNFQHCSLIGWYSIPALTCHVERFHTWSWELIRLTPIDIRKAVLANQVALLFMNINESSPFFAKKNIFRCILFVNHQHFDFISPSGLQMHLFISCFPTLLVDARAQNIEFVMSLSSDSCTWLPAAFPQALQHGLQRSSFAALPFCSVTQMVINFGRLHSQSLKPEWWKMMAALFET